MQGFEYAVPTKIIFGRGAEQQCGAELKQRNAHKVMLVYGGGSAVRSGLLDRVKDVIAKEEISVIEWGGVKPNPLFSHAQKGAKLAAAENVDFVLAVGGGSVIDTAKAIAHGAANPDEDLWQIWTGKAPLNQTLPVGVILTIAASGSETSSSAVLTNDEIGQKIGFESQLNRPVFAVMNPELTFTLPKYQIACGVADIMMHTLERYFIPRQTNRMTDEIAEGLLRTVIANGRIALENPEDYDAMSEIMWCGSLSHNGLTGLGRRSDFSVHTMGHELSARFDSTHGATLTALWGSWAQYVCEKGIDRFCHYGEAVWGIHTDDPEQTAKQAIDATVNYFRELGLPTSFTELGIGVQPDEVLEEMAMQATRQGRISLSLMRRLRVDDVHEIYRMANH